jgi:hypothetical protein
MYHLNLNYHWKGFLVSITPHEINDRVHFLLQKNVAFFLELFLLQLIWQRIIRKITERCFILLRDISINLDLIFRNLNRTLAYSYLRADIVVNAVLAPEMILKYKKIC